MIFSFLVKIRLAAMIVGFNLLALGIIYYRQPKYLALGSKSSKQ